MGTHLSRLKSNLQILKMFTTVARRNAAQKIAETTIVKPHKFVYGKALKYWAAHGKHVKAELIPNPAAIIGGVPAALSNTVGFVSGGFLKMSVKELVLTGMCAAEIFVWFSLGEIIGKKKFIGYDTRNFGEQMGNTLLLPIIPLPESITKSNFLC